MTTCIRASKFRNVYGTAGRKDECFENCRIAHSSAGDYNAIKANSTFLSVTWETSGGGAFAVLPLACPSRLPENQPLFSAHKSNVLDTDFSPFNEHVVASVSEDCAVMVWNIPEEITCHQTNPSVVLLGHQRRVNLVSFHPTASNILASASGDCSIKIWDINAAKCCFELSDHKDAIQSFAYNWTGNNIVSTSRDKMIRISDIRSAKNIHESKVFDSLKPARAIYAGDKELIITTCFSKSSDRQIVIWDTRNMSAPCSSKTLDHSPGTLFPHFDCENNIVYSCGKGDGTISFYELVGGELFGLSDYKSSEPQRGICFLPKRACRASANEIARAYKVHTSIIEPISFTVPRRAAGFQSDIFPPTPGPEPSMTAAEWLSGKTLPPILIEMDSKLNNSLHSLALNPSSSCLVESPMKTDSSHGSGASAAAAAQELAAEKKILLAKLAEKEARILELESQIAKLISGRSSSSGSESSSSGRGSMDTSPVRDGSKSPASPKK